MSFRARRFKRDAPRFRERVSHPPPAESEREAPGSTNLSEGLLAPGGEPATSMGASEFEIQSPGTGKKGFSHPVGRRPFPGEDVWPPPDLIALGRFLRPHGLRGELRLYPYTRTAEDLLAQCPDDVLVWHPDGRTESLHIESLDVHQRVVLIALEAVRDRTEAERFRDAFLCVREEDRWELPAGEFYADHLAGLELRDADSGEAIGRVLRVVDGAAHDYLETAIPGGSKPVLVPFIRQFVVAVDLEGGWIGVRLPPGLLDLDQIPEDDTP